MERRDVWQYVACETGEVVNAPAKASPSSFAPAMRRTVRVTWDPPIPTSEMLTVFDIAFDSTFN